MKGSALSGRDKGEYANTQDSHVKTCLLLLGASAPCTSFADLITPEDPQAYEPFKIELDVDDLYAYYAPHVDVENNEIRLLHIETIDVVFLPPSEAPIVIEIAGLPPGTYAIKSVELPHRRLFGETYRTMMADGWIGEGVVFCSPPRL